MQGKSPMNNQTRTSPLREAFEAAGAEFTQSHGCEIATRVHDDLKEYLAVRENVGISDFTDQGKIRVRGQGARELLDEVLSGHVRNMPENTMRMMLALDDEGAI